MSSITINYFFQGRTFRTIIQEFVNVNPVLNDSYIPTYETPEGKKNYDLTVDSLRKNFPQYVRELEGTADGAQVPFHKVRKKKKYQVHLNAFPTVENNQSNKKTP